LINQSVEKVVFLVVGSNTPRSGFVAAVSRLVARGLRHVDVSGDDLVARVGDGGHDIVGHFAADLVAVDALDTVRLQPERERLTRP